MGRWKTKLFQGTVDVSVRVARASARSFCGESAQKASLSEDIWKAVEIPEIVKEYVVSKRKRIERHV